MPPKRISSHAAPKRSASPSPPAFDDELHRIFSLLCVLGGAKESCCSGKGADHQGELTADTFREALHVIHSKVSTAATGSGAAGAKQLRSSHGPLRAAGASISGSAANATDGAHRSVSCLSILLTKEGGFEAADADGSSKMDFKAFAAWQRKLLQNAARSYAARKQLVSDIIAELESLEKRHALITIMRSAETAKALRDGICDAVATLSRTDEELLSQQERLTKLEAPFSVMLSTLNGEQHEVEVARVQTVGMLRHKASKLFERKPYRLLLASRSARLEPDSASLEESGITMPGMDIGVAFGKEDPWQEMPFAEFLDMLVEHKFADDMELRRIRRDTRDGVRENSYYVERYAPSLQAAIDLQNQKKAWDEAEELGQRQVAELMASMPPAHASSSEVAAALAEYEVATEQVQKEVASTEAFCADWGSRARKIREEATALLDTIMPRLEHLRNVLNNLNKEDLCDAQALREPPLPCKHIMKALCLLMEMLPEPTARCKTDPERFDGYWKAGKVLLRDCCLIDKLICFDKDNIDPATIRSLNGFVCNPDFTPERVRSCGPLWEALCVFIRTMLLYHNVAEQVLPQRWALMNCERNLAAANQRLMWRRDRLGTLLTESAKLRAMAEEP